MDDLSSGLSDDVNHPIEGAAPCVTLSADPSRDDLDGYPTPCCTANPDASAHTDPDANPVATF